MLGEYEVVSGKYARLEDGRRVRYLPGDTFIPTQEEIEERNDILRPVESSRSEDAVEDADEDVLIEDLGGGWYLLPDGSRVQGGANASQRLAELLEEE